MSAEHNNPIPVAVGLIRVRIALAWRSEVLKLVAVRRAIQPKLGELAFPGGYVDAGESAEIAAAREVYEETGLSTKSWQYQPLKTLITPRNQLLIFMLYTPVLSMDQWEHMLSMYAANENFRLETSELVLVDTDDTLCFPAHLEVLQSKHLWA